MGIVFAKLSLYPTVPATLVEKTAEAAIALEGGGSVAVAISASVLRLVKGVLDTMFLTKLKALGASFLIVSIVGFGAGVLARQDAPKNQVPYDEGTPKFPVFERKQFFTRPEIE